MGGRTRLARGGGGGGAGGKSYRAGRAGPQAPEITLGPGRRLRLALARRGPWARHAQAADASTATRAGPVGAGGEAPPRARASAARLRPLRGGGEARLARPPLGRLLLTTAPARPRPGAAQPRPHLGVPARLSGRGTSSAPQHRKTQKTPHATASAHTRVPSPGYIRAIQPNLLRPGRAVWWPIPTAHPGLFEQQLGTDSG